MFGSVMVSGLSHIWVLAIQARPCATHFFLAMMACRFREQRVLPALEWWLPAVSSCGRMRGFHRTSLGSHDGSLWLFLLSHVLLGLLHYALGSKLRIKGREVLKFGQCWQDKVVRWKDVTIWRVTEVEFWELVTGLCRSSKVMVRNLLHSVIISHWQFYTWI